MNSAHPRVVGSFGNAKSLREASADGVAGDCDLIEIRLDLLAAEGVDAADRPWSHLTGIPVLFTARRGDEGGAGELPADRRSGLLEQVLGEAAVIDVELASADEMAPLLDKVRESGIPWVASWHDFDGRPDSFDRIPAMAARAAAAGATCFKAAVRLHTPRDAARLAEILKEVDVIPLSLMGMGALAPVSRLLCAQYGSVLNYGYLGDAPTAPGQWSAGLLKRAIAASESI
nr:type I 3-dehydroquinate dehydratase [Luteolibacter marinus]